MSSLRTTDARQFAGARAQSLHVTPARRARCFPRAIEAGSSHISPLARRHVAAVASTNDAIARGVYLFVRCDLAGLREPSTTVIESSAHISSSESLLVRIDPLHAEWHGITALPTAMASAVRRRSAWAPLASSPLASTPCSCCCTSAGRPRGLVLVPLEAELARAARARAVAARACLHAGSLGRTDRPKARVDVHAGRGTHRANPIARERFTRAASIQVMPGRARLFCTSQR